MFRKELQFENSRTIEENRTALSHITKKTNLSLFFFIKEGPHDFEGKIENNSFLLRPVVGYRTSFLPMIQGKFIEKDGKTVIPLSLYLRKDVIFFILAFSISALILAITTLFLNPIMILIPLFLIAFAWGLTAICFHIEAVKSMKILKEIFRE